LTSKSVTVALSIAVVIVLAGWGSIELSRAPVTSTIGAPNTIAAPTLTTTATATTGGGGLAIVHPPIRNITTTMTGVKSNPNCASVPASSVYQAYQKNITAASIQYGGKTMCLSGNIGSVSNFQSGVHMSCTAQDPDIEYLFGDNTCSGSVVPYNNLASYVEWFWNGTAGQMGLDSGPSSVVGNCTVDGLQDGNLVLRGCYMVNVISTSPNPMDCCGTPYTGLVVSNVTLYVSKQDTASVVNMTVHVVNPSENEWSFWEMNIPNYLNMSAHHGESEPIGITHFAPPHSSMTLNATIPRYFFGRSLPSPGEHPSMTIFFGTGFGAGEFGDTIPRDSLTLPATVVWYTSPVFGPAVVSVASGNLRAADFRSAGSTPTFSCASPSRSYLNFTKASAESGMTFTNRGLASTKIVDVVIDSGSQTFRYAAASTCFVDKAGSAAAMTTLLFPRTSYFPQDAVVGQAYHITFVLATGDTISFSGSFG
jgi:hypothetical protein